MAERMDGWARPLGPAKQKPDLIQVGLWKRHAWLAKRAQLMANAEMMAKAKMMANAENVQFTGLTLVTRPPWR
jgi:hypothetical protein